MAGKLDYKNSVIEEITTDKESKSTAGIKTLRQAIHELLTTIIVVLFTILICVHLR